MPIPGLVPELDVSDLDRSLAFYVGIVGFRLAYERPEERFAYLVLDDAHLMIEEAAGPGRRFHTGVLEHPFGRGMNLQIRTADAAALNARILAAGLVPYVALEERGYRGKRAEIGMRQFVVADPDGYLLRFVTALGERALRD